MPKGAAIIHVADQRDTICLWFEIPDQANSHEAEEPEARIIEVIGTGIRVQARRRVHLGSLLMGEYVWHVYEVLQPSQKL